MTVNLDEIEKEACRDIRYTETIGLTGVGITVVKIKEDAERLLALCDHIRALETENVKLKRELSETALDALSASGEAHALYAENMRLRDAQWLPINTAKKDGTPHLLKLRDDLRSIRPGPPDLARWEGLQFVGRHHVVEDDGFDAGWSFAAPVGMGGFPDEWIEGWRPISQETHGS